MTTERYYAGIGSRETPVGVLRIMTSVANTLSTQGYVLRSGHADGADQAFEAGALDVCEIYLPWKGFNGSSSNLYLDRLFAKNPQLLTRLFDLSRELHPNWRACSPAVQKLHMRNALQILGADLKTPSEFVVCWTRDGKIVGGTGQAIRIASHFEIPVWNLASEEDRVKFYEKFNLARLIAHD